MTYFAGRAVLGLPALAVSKIGALAFVMLAATVSQSRFGAMPDGTAVSVFTLTNATGVEVRAMSYGAILVSIRTPDRAGRFADVALGFDALDDYVKRPRFFGALV